MVIARMVPMCGDVYVALKAPSGLRALVPFTLVLTSLAASNNPNSQTPFAQESVKHFYNIFKPDESKRQTSSCDHEN